ncbi:MAG TPA: hypothetical protein VK133_02110 [Amoebophilaceae bacterium]|nr:hypothetical protein [Amoebophilaceae bacterium]
MKKITPRERNAGAGKAYNIEFKDGTKIDINPDRVKMDVPKPQNSRPGGMGKHDFIKDGGLPEGTKVVVEGTKTLPHKRTLTEAERKLLEDLLVE